MKKYSKLVPEEYPENYNGYRFISLIKYMDKPQIAIVDNIVNDIIHAYVLDECQPANLDETEIVSYGKKWYEDFSHLIPFSVYLSRNNIMQYSAIIKCFPVDYVSRILGPLFVFNMGNPIKIKRKRKKDIPDTIEIVYTGRVRENADDIL